MNKPVKDKVILGIDPGTNLMGYGILHIIDSKPKVVALGVIDLRKYANHYLKLAHIHERVQGIISSDLPDEELPPGEPPELRIFSNVTSISLSAFTES